MLDAKIADVLPEDCTWSYTVAGGKPVTIGAVPSKGALSWIPNSSGVTCVPPNKKVTISLLGKSVYGESSDAVEIILTCAPP